MRRSFLWLLLLAMVGFVFWKSMETPALFDAQHSGEVQHLNVSEGRKIQSPFTLTGEIRGPWFFEASLPVTLYDADGSVIAQAPAQALKDWMTTGRNSNAHS